MTICSFALKRKAQEVRAIGTTGVFVGPRCICGGGRGGAVSLGAIRTLLSDLVRAESIAIAEKNPEAIPHELVVQYIVGAYMAVMTWWLDGGAKIASHRIDAMFRRLAIEGMPSSFAGKPSR